MTIDHRAPTRAPLSFTLSPDLEAHEPPEARGLRRDQVRLMVSHYRDDRLYHARFDDLPRFLKPGDLLVANDSATLPAALTSRRQDDSTVALHLSTRLPGGLWVVEPRKVSVAPSKRSGCPAGGVATLLAPYAGSARLWVARLDLPAPFLGYLARWGQPIAYPYVRERWSIEMYQTVYANEPGSAEMPSAGRAFTPDLLARLAEVGVGFTTLTLHTGVASLESHERPYEEPFTVPPATADAVQAARLGRSPRDRHRHDGCQSTGVGRRRGRSRDRDEGLDRSGHYARARSPSGGRPADRLPRAGGVTPGHALGHRRARPP